VWAIDRAHFFFKLLDFGEECLPTELMRALLFVLRRLRLSATLENACLISLYRYRFALYRHIDPPAHPKTLALGCIVGQQVSKVVLVGKRETWPAAPG